MTSPYQTPPIDTEEVLALQRVYLNTREEVDNLLERIYQCCGDAVLVMDVGQLVQDTERSLGFWVYYTDDVPEEAITGRLQIRDLLNHLYESTGWSSTHMAAVRLGINLRALRPFAAHCIDQGWAERGQSNNALRITPAGRRARERQKPE